MKKEISIKFGGVFRLLFALALVWVVEGGLSAASWSPTDERPISGGISRATITVPGGDGPPQNTAYLA